ncbi:hypothetical protein [Tahibacter soli]|uniref:Uncharacterized protein n=1 Tax=Tahibacter soli TaxID=2983605 RepID=A0A9X3YQ68_9GAMM|nr:hypothetical protein [Tahibacter soli]MDC8015872.1 hypothetical protein [Tahibacter soli]
MYTFIVPWDWTAIGSVASAAAAIAALITAWITFRIGQRTLAVARRSADVAERAAQTSERVAADMEGKRKRRRIAHALSVARELDAALFRLKGARDALARNGTNPRNAVEDALDKLKMISLPALESAMTEIDLFDYTDVVNLTASWSNWERLRFMFGTDFSRTVGDASRVLDFTSISVKQLVQNWFSTRDALVTSAGIGMLPGIFLCVDDTHTSGT